MILRNNVIVAALALACATHSFSQAPATPAPSAANGSAAAPAAQAPADPFPPRNPRWFDAASPTTETVEGFLKAIWGYDSNRTWRVGGIQKTTAPGVARVTVFVADSSQGNQVQTLSFFVTPDSRHAIADQIFDFGADPFAQNRARLAKDAHGPATGPAGASLQIVEFADFQCPHCKEGEATMDSLRHDFPAARIVFQNFPLVDIHPFAFKAAAYGDCVAKKGAEAFHTYLQDVFDHQGGLTAEDGDQTLANAAQKAGANPAEIATCAASPATSAQVNAELKLGEDVGVNQTPMIAVNGHLLPLGGMPYETLKQIIAWESSHNPLATTK